MGRHVAYQCCESRNFLGRQKCTGIRGTDLGDKIEVSIGSIPHPMEEKHYITSIEVLTEKKVLRKELKPGDEPKAKFCVKMEKVLAVREYCNVHGLWKNQLK